MDSKIEITLGDSSICSMDHLWTPIRLASYSSEDSYGWIYDSPSSNRRDVTMELLGKWQNAQPNGEGAQKCIERDSSNYFGDTEYQDQLCAICNIPSAQTYYLRGRNDVIKEIDRKYFLSVPLYWNQSKLQFDGEKSSQITWHPLDEITELLFKQKDEYKILTYNQSPFGLLSSLEKYPKWVFTNVSLSQTLLWHKYINLIFSVQSS